MEEPEGRRSVPAVRSWPWNCIECGTTIYGDGLYCAACEREQRRRERCEGAEEPPADLVAWMREQSYPEFVTKVTAVSGAELLLTTIWLRLLASGAVYALLPAVG